MRNKGFTMIEMLVALLLLSVVMLSLARFMGSFLHGVGQSTVRTAATEAANERIGLILADPAYASLATTWAATDSGFPGYPRMVRRTTLQRTTGTAPARDYTTVTVRVSEPAMSSPVTLTTVVAKP